MLQNCRSGAYIYSNEIRYFIHYKNKIIDAEEGSI